MERQEYSTLIKKGKEAGLSGYYEKAVSFFMEAVQLEPDRAEAHYNLSIALGMLGRHDEAQTASSEAVRLQPVETEPPPDLDLAHALLDEPEVTPTEEPIPREVPSPEGVPSLMKEGQEALASEDYEKAVSAYKEVVDLEPENARAHLEMGRALGELRRYEKALDAYKEAIRLEPEEHEEAYVRSAAYLMVLGRHGEAVETYEEVIGLRPDLVEARRGLGMACRALDRLDKAEAAFNEALRIDPDDAEARRGLKWVTQEIEIAQGAAEAAEVKEAVVEKPKPPKAPLRKRRIVFAVILVLVTTAVAYGVSVIGVAGLREAVERWVSILRNLF